MSTDLVTELRAAAEADGLPLYERAAREIEHLTAAYAIQADLSERLAHAIYLLRTRNNTGAHLFADETVADHRAARRTSREDLL